MKNEGIDNSAKLPEDVYMMMDMAPIQLWFLLDVETYGRVNQFHADFMGKNKSEMEFKKLSEIYPAEVAQGCMESNREVYKTQKTVYSEEWIQNSRGEKRLIAISKTPKYSKDGEKIEYIICFGHDITERREALKKLTQNEENFRTFIETIEDIVVIGNTAGQIIYINPAGAAKLGYSEEELKQMRILDLHPEWARKEAQSIIEAMFDGKRNSCPLPLLNKSGSIIPVETHVWLGKWNEENCIFGLAKDLSKEQESLQKFEKLFTMNPALMAISVLPERKLTDVNEAYQRVTGYTIDEIRGKTSKEIGIYADEETEKTIAEILQKYGNIREAEVKLKTRTGEIREGLFSGDIFESNGTKYFLSVFVDISERKKAERERERTIKELQSASEQIKKLKGILPICASCKKIRDDKGYWEQVESYISMFTDVKFTHGICPDCMKKLYSEYTNYSQKDTNKNK